MDSWLCGLYAHWASWWCPQILPGASDWHYARNDDRHCQSTAGDRRECFLENNGLPLGTGLVCDPIYIDPQIRAGVQQSTDARFSVVEGSWPHGGR